MFRGYLFNGARRLAGQMPYWIVPVAIGELSPYLPILYRLTTGVFLSPKAMEHTPGPKATTRCALPTLPLLLPQLTLHVRVQWQNSKAGHLALHPPGSEHH